MKLKDQLKADVLTIILVLANVVFALVMLGRLPEIVPSHWGWNGQVNGQMDKYAYVWMMIGLTLGIYLLLTVLPLIDPRRANYAAFRRIYAVIKLAVILFISVVHVMTALAALGVDVPVKAIVPGIVGLLLIVLGAVMPGVKQNYFVGIRVPWTLNDPENWTKTHKFGGVFFIIGGLIMLASSFFAGRFAIIWGIIVAVVPPIVYSYALFHIKERGGKK